MTVSPRKKPVVLLGEDAKRFTERKRRNEEKVQEKIARIKSMKGVTLDEILKLDRSER